MYGGGGEYQYYSGGGEYQYGEEEPENGGAAEMDDETDEISQDDTWTVISSYFEEKGLVRQQLDSFDEFIQNTMQEIVDESAHIEIRPESQHNPGRSSEFAEVRSVLRLSFDFACRVVNRK